MGRVRNAKLHEAWRRRLARFRPGRESVLEFCQRERISAPSFYAWRKRLATDGDGTMTRDADRRSDPRQDSGSSQFLELNVAVASIVEIDLPGGTRIRVPASHTTGLRTVMRSLRELAREESSC